VACLLLERERRWPTFLDSLGIKHNSLELYTAWKNRGAHDWATARTKLAAAGSEGDKLLFLRDQIEMCA
jgi:hypothetical protein